MFWGCVALFAAFSLLVANDVIEEAVGISPEDELRAIGLSR